MRPAEFHGLLGRLAGEQAVEQPDAKPSPPPTRSCTSSSQVGERYVWPSIQASAPQVWRFVECTSRSVVATTLTADTSRHAIDHLDEHARIERRGGGDLRAGDAEAVLQVLFVADEDVHVRDDAARISWARGRPPAAVHSRSR